MQSPETLIVEEELAEQDESVLRDRPAWFRGAFVFLLLFTVMVYLRPQEIVPQLALLRLPRLIAGLAFLSFILGFLKYKERLPIRNTEVILVVLLAVFVLWSVPGSAWPGGSFQFIKEMASKTYLIFFLVVFVVNSIPRVRRLLFVLEACGSFMALYAAYQIATGQGHEVQGRLILPGLSGDPNDRALVMVFLSPLALFSLFETRSKLMKGIRVFFIATYLLGIVQSLSRGGMLGFVAVSGYFAVRMFRERKKLVIFLVVAGLVGATLLSDRVITRFQSIFEHELDEVNTIEARTEILKRGIGLMLQHPLFGVGAGVFHVAYGESLEGAGRWMAPHNSLIQVGAETGILGLVTYLLLCWTVYRNCRRIEGTFIEYDLEPSMIEFARAVEFSLVGFLVSAFFLSQAYSWHFFYLVGISGALRRIAYRIEEEELPEEEFDEEEEEEASLDPGGVPINL